MSQMILEEVLQPGLNIVFCGTQAGRVSAEKRAYYAGPGNKFWDTLHAVGLTPRRLQPFEFRKLPNHGIGLTDVAKHTSGPDAVIRKEHADAVEFWLRLSAAGPHVLAFNGKRAASIALERPGPALRYGPAGMREGTALFILPSTSGAAAGFWDIRPWQDLAGAVRALSA